MESIAHIALSRQTALNRQMSAISNNLANVNTTAYRREGLMFEEVLRDTQDGETGNLSFVQDVSSFYNTESGALKSTGNPLDMGIQGDGYFTVETGDGPRYTRDGSFMIDGENQLVTKQGRLVLDGQGNPIDIPEAATTIEVARDGTISTENGELATLDIVTFENPQALMKRADNLYDPEDMAPQPSEEAVVHQGMLEDSNVQAITEMTEMMDVVRSYQSTKKMMDNDHDRQLRAIRSLVSSK